MDDPIARLPDFAIVAATPAARIARGHGCLTFQAAARHVWHLPYGRNSDRANPLLAFAERRGTCSTKHAFLAALARDHGQPLDLMLGIYLMDGRNTPRIAPVLDRAGLAAIPEAHCYLRAAGARIDLTHPPGCLPGAPVTEFLAEEVIEPEQIGEYKTAYHRRFLAAWEGRFNGTEQSVDELWAIREACIRALSAGP